MPNTFIFIQHYYPELILRIKQQCMLIGLSMGLAIMIGIPLGVFINNWQRLQKPVQGITAAIWTIPILALLALLVPVFGIGILPAIIANRIGLTDCVFEVRI